MKPREWILPTPPTNNKVATSNPAAAASNPPPEIPPDHSDHMKFNYTPDSCVLPKLQFWISEVRRLLQHWIWQMLFTSYVYVLKTVVNKKNLHQMAKVKDEKSTNLNNQLSDSDTSDDEPINPELKTSVEEKTLLYNTRFSTSDSSRSYSFLGREKPYCGVRTQPYKES